MKKYSHLASVKVQLVLVGVGLDVIRLPRRVGTDPELSRLVTMVGPNFSNLVEADIVKPEVATALAEARTAMDEAEKDRDAKQENYEQL